MTNYLADARASKNQAILGNNDETLETTGTEACGSLDQANGDSEAFHSYYEGAISSLEDPAMTEGLLDYLEILFTSAAANLCPQHSTEVVKMTALMRSEFLLDPGVVTETAERYYAAMELGDFAAMSHDQLDRTGQGFCDGLLPNIPEGKTALAVLVVRESVNDELESFKPAQAMTDRWCPEHRAAFNY